VSWLQDEVLQRTIPPKGLRKGRRRPAGRPTQLEAQLEAQLGAQLGVAVEGSRLPTGPRKAGASPSGIGTVDAVMAGPDLEEEEEEEEEEEGGGRRKRERQRLKH
jgi:hypothetical protein